MKSIDFFYKNLHFIGYYFIPALPQIGLSELKGPAQRFGRFSELGSAQLKTFGLMLDTSPE